MSMGHALALGFAVRELQLQLEKHIFAGQHLAEAKATELSKAIQGVIFTMIQAEFGLRDEKASPATSTPEQP